MELNNPDNHPTHKTLAETNPEPIVDMATPTVTYFGYAKLGVRQNDAKWKIVRKTINLTITITEYADGNMEYDNVWNDRTSLNYSR